MESTISHISIIVKSETSVVFYSRLGFNEIKRIIRDKDTVVLMEGNGIGLEIFIDPSHPDRATEPENCGLRFFAIKADNFEEISQRLNAVRLRRIGSISDIVLYLIRTDYQFRFMNKLD